MTNATPSANAVETLERPPEKPLAAAVPAQSGANGGILCNSVEALDAQVAMWKVQFAIGVLRTVFATVFAVLALALGVYGFTLLDQAAHWPLAKHAPEWVSPLVRGAVYFLLPLILLAPAFKLLFNKPAASNASEKGNAHAA